MKYLIPALFISLLAASTGALADNEGAYIGLGFGSTSYNDDNRFDGLALDDTDNGSKFYGGYRFSDHFALEASIAGMGEYTANNPTSGGKTKLKFGTFSVSAVGLIPLADNKLDLFGHLGVGSISLDQDNPQWDDDGGAFVLGFGLAYNPMEQLTFRAAIDNYAFRVVNYYWDGAVLNKEKTNQAVGMFYLSAQYNFR